MNLLSDYAKFLVQNSQYEIPKQLFIDTLGAVDKIEVFTKKHFDAIEALCILFEHENIGGLNEILFSIICNPFFERNVARVTSVLIGRNPKKIARIVEIIDNLVVEGPPTNRLIGLIEGLGKKASFVASTVLESRVLDLRAFLSSVPSGAAVDALLQIHYQCVLVMLKGIEKFDDHDLLISYAEAISLFLANSSNQEPFLEQVLREISRLIDPISSFATVVELACPPLFPVLVDGAVDLGQCIEAFNVVIKNTFMDCESAGKLLGKIVGMSGLDTAVSLLSTVPLEKVGTVAVASGSEVMGRNALSMLLTEAMRCGSCRTDLLAQANLLCLLPGAGILNEILDYYTLLLAKFPNEMGQVIVELASTTKTPLQAEVVVFSIFQFKNLTPPLLQALSIALSRAQFSNSYQKVEAFQNFWFTVVSENLESPFLETIAQFSPVLIKERDRFQASPKALSPELLGGGPRLVRLAEEIVGVRVEPPQALWLLSVYKCESLRNDPSLLADYVCSETVHLLNLAPSVQSLVGRLIKGGQKPLDGLLKKAVSAVGHSNEKIHLSALELCTMILDNNALVHGSEAVWTGILHRLSHLHKVAQQDHTFAELFADALSLARRIFTGAIRLFPHTFQTFAALQINKNISVSTSVDSEIDSVGVYEVLRAILPSEYGIDPTPLSLSVQLCESVGEVLPFGYASWTNFLHRHPEKEPSLMISSIFDVSFDEPVDPLAEKISFGHSPTTNSNSEYTKISKLVTFVEFWHERWSLFRHPMHRKFAVFLLGKKWEFTVKCRLWIYAIDVLGSGHEAVLASFSRHYEQQNLWTDADPARLALLNDLLFKVVSVCPCLFVDFVQHDLEYVQVWRGTFQMTRYKKPRKKPAGLSVNLSLRWAQRFRERPTSSLTSPLSAPDLVAYALSTGMTVPERWLLYAPPASPLTALSLFGSPVPAQVNYAMRSLESLPPGHLFFYIPQLVQALRSDPLGYIERTILHIAKASPLFAHQIIWNLKANTHKDDAGQIPDDCKPIFEGMVARVSAGMRGEQRDFFQREFTFFDQVTGISGALKPYVKREKSEKKAKIDAELRKVKVDPGVYLPSNPESVVVDIDYDSGRPLQSHAKAPFMATFRVTDGAGNETWQSAIFKVGDDCRQDVLALQVIAACKSVFVELNLPLYLFPYRVVATAPGCGIIEVIPNSISRDQLGREKLNSLYEYFVFRFGPDSGPRFRAARREFIKSLAAYSVVCYLLAVKDRHNGNIMIDNAGHIIHIDFGFIIDMSPGGVNVENVPFKLTSEMLQVIAGPMASYSNVETSPHFQWFKELCVQAFLALRIHRSSLVELVRLMATSGLPCFGNRHGPLEAVRRFEARFRSDLSDHEARQFILECVKKSCQNLKTYFYDVFQLYTNGIPY